MLSNEPTISTSQKSLAKWRVLGPIKNEILIEDGVFSTFSDGYGHYCGMVMDGKRKPQGLGRYVTV